MDGPAQSHTDTCRYQFHLPSPSSDSLPALAAQLSTLALSLSKDYIWHHPGGLALTPSKAPLSSTSAGGVVWLEGSTNVTDAVDDEWLLVWLLVQLSKQVDGAVVGVSDEDGEFLLIEGADELPRWLTPDNATNRVWIYKGELHLVPLEHVSAVPFPAAEATPTFNPDEDGFIDQQTAINLVRDPTVNTRAAKELEDVVFARIAGYPQKMSEHIHTTLAYLPTEIALALTAEPALAAEAVAAFYEREPRTLKSCNAMTRFPPSSPSTATSPSSSSDPSAPLPPTVLAPTRLTRPLYSQLVLQRFFAPKPFDKAGWMNGAADEAEKRRRSVGMKLACGFEMLYQLTAPQPRLSEEQSEVRVDEPAFAGYMQGLVKAGFFEGEVEGSAKFEERRKVAVEGWRKAQPQRKTKTFAQRVDDAIAAARLATPPLPNRVVGHLTPAAAAALESSEEFLSLDEQGLEDLLQSRGPGKGGLGNLDSDFSDFSDSDEEEEGKEKLTQEQREERQARRVARKLEGMAGKVEEFVEGRGAVDGAQFSDEESDDDDSDAEVPTLSPEERATRTAALVAPLSAEDWGHKSTPAAAPAPPPLDRPVREPKLTRNVYEGASDDEDSSEGEDDTAPPKEGAEYEGEDEDDPAVEGEVDLDLEEEMDEFLRFATETLGLSKEQYAGILGEREKRGAYIPGPAKPKKVNVMPSASSSKPAAATDDVPPATRAPPAQPQQPLRNPNLSDFDALMSQMEAELARNKPSTARVPTATSQQAPKGKAAGTAAAKVVNPADAMDVDVDSDEDGEGQEDEEMAQMDDELASLFKSVAGQEAERGEGGMMDLNLVKNFLESFQSQGGFGGPAGNMAGRMGFQLPRDSMREE